MTPKTISASSLNVADKCLARWKAENLLFTPSPDVKTAADIGTSCHGALEDFVRVTCIDKTEAWGWSLLEAFYMKSYLKTFDTVEHNTPEYRDGLALLKSWFERTDLSDRKVLSVESKRRMPIPSSVGDIPLTYIIDRLDYYEEGGLRIVEVVDYKTIRAMLSPDDIRGKLQARIYDLAIRAQLKVEGIEYDQVRVVFDLLRHNARPGVIFTHEEAVETWAGIKARLERILATPGDNPPESLNDECGYCVRKQNCRAIRRNIEGGGVFSISTDLALVARNRMEMANQAKALESAISELDKLLIGHAKHEGVLSFSEDGLQVNIGARKTRTIDSVAAASILGPEVMGRYGKLRISDIDALMKSGDLTDEQVTGLKRIIGYSIGAESVKVVPK